MIENHWSVIPFTGSSMNPTFQGVDSVWVDFSKSEPPRLGDVLFYRDQSEEWVCHRLIFEEHEQYVLMGDTNSSTDLLSRQAVWGIVRAAQKQKISFLFVRTPLMGWICYFQRQQTISTNLFAKKIYRFLSKTFLYFNKWFSIRSLNHRTS